MKVKQVLDDLIKSWKYPSKWGVNPYINFSKLILKWSTWKTSSTLRSELWIGKKESIIKHLSVDEYRKYDILDNQIAKLLEKWNLSYVDIKKMSLKVY